MDQFHRTLIETAANLELWAVWDDPAAPDGVAAALILAPEDEHAEAAVAAVRVANEVAAMALQGLVD
jgi:hypothetical protein